MDAYAKTVLTVIAACLLLQVAQGFGLAAAPAPVSSSSSETANQYVLQPVPMIRLLFRFDRATGQTWTMPLQPQKERIWTLIGEAPPEAMAPEEGDGTSLRPEAAGEAEE
jgi:hypothetical protein